MLLLLNETCVLAQHYSFNIAFVMDYHKKSVFEKCQTLLKCHFHPDLLFGFPVTGVPQICRCVSSAVLNGRAGCR